MDQFQRAMLDAELGMARSLDRAERGSPGWGDAALTFLRRYAETHEEFPGFFVTAAAQADAEFPKAKGITYLTASIGDCHEHEL